MKEYYIIGQDFDDGMKWYFIKDYTNEEQPVSNYDYTEDKAEAQVFESYEDALDTLMSVHNFQDVCVSDGGDDFAPVEDWKIAYYDETGALYDGRTGKYIVDYDGLEESYNTGKSMKFNEATTILKRAGYKVLNETVDIVDEVRDLLKHYGYEDDTIENEIMDYDFIDELAQQGYDAYDIADELLDAVYGNVNLDVDEDEDETKMNEALEGPATSKQLWTLFKLTHKDYRGQDLSKQAASDMIGELLGKKKNGDTTPKPIKAPASDENSPVKVGEIYHRNWGYDMSINTYYKVLMVRGKKATVVELGKKVISGSLQQGKVVPDEKNRETKTTIALIKPDGSLRIRFMGDGNYETYHKWDGQPDYEDHMD